jgi:putative tricarboxylic transport membrane protein
MLHSSLSKTSQTLIAAGILLLALLLAWGAVSIPGEAGYGGVGPNFLPWLVSGALLVCGAWLLWEAWGSGYTKLELASGAERGDWPAFAWVSAGVLACASLITTIGFVLACTLCFTLAVRGLRAAQGQGAGNLRQTAVDVATGLAIAAPVYWLFGKLLKINLPGLTATGWL